ncbi:MAG: hypothetical protein KatS3mg111_2388 [Pirellulaceae bacterium]|nr:MAG: hypothetical protein KatS3mg111_2388 [Pirellulaceae bacterium]
MRCTWDREEIFVWADGQEVLRIVDFDAEGADAARLMNRYLWGAAVDQLLADEQFQMSSLRDSRDTATRTPGSRPELDYLAASRLGCDSHGVPDR